MHLFSFTSVYLFQFELSDTPFLSLLVMSSLFPLCIKDWLEKNANYEAIVDGANIGLYQQNFTEGGFSVPQVVHLKLVTCYLFLLDSLLTTNFYNSLYLFLLEF